MNRLYTFLGGRTATFVWLYSIAGVVLCATGKLTGEFVAFTTAVLGGVVVRAAVQDRVEPPTAK